MLYPKEIRNYRDWTTIDVDLWRHYWFAMVNRGVMAQPYWWDEQWTISVQHTEADIDKHLSAFDDIAASLAKAQQERAGQPVGRALRFASVSASRPATMPGHVAKRQSFRAGRSPVRNLLFARKTLSTTAQPAQPT
jgi:hypothetical protein